MTTRPIVFPDFALNDVNDPVSGQPNVWEPGQALKDSGWTRSQKPYRQHLNWLHRTTNEWIKWIDSLIDPSITSSSVIFDQSLKTTNTPTFNGVLLSGLLDANNGADIEGNADISGTLDSHGAVHLYSTVQIDGITKHGDNYINNDGTASKGISFTADNRLSMIATAVVSGDRRTVFSLTDDTTMAAGVGGGLNFIGKYKADGSLSEFASVKGIKANATESNSSGQLHFQTRLSGSNLATQMIIDENGNVAIGKNALEAWNSAYTALQIGGNNAIMSMKAEGADSSIFITNNIYYDGTWKRFSTDECSAILMSAGNITFRTDGVGNADEAFSPTTRMVISNSGNVGIGTLTPATQLDLSANNNAIVGAAPLNTLRFTDTDTSDSSGQPMGRIEFYSNDLNDAGVKAYIEARAQDTSPDGNLYFATQKNYTGLLSEAMTILYDGNVGIGTTTPSSLLHLYGPSPTIRVESSSDTGTIQYFKSDRTTAGANIADITALWGVNNVARISMRTGSDAINKDCGYISLMTSNDASTLVDRLKIGQDGTIATFGNYINNGGTANSGLRFDSTNITYIKSSASTYGDISRVISIEDDTAMGTGVGGAISFGGKYTTTNSFTYFAGIKSYKANATDGNYSGQLHFQTRLNGSLPTTKMIIDENGNVGIGTSSPTVKLDINSDILRLRTAKTPASSSASGNVGDICWDANFVYVCVATNTWKRTNIDTWA